MIAENGQNLVFICGLPRSGTTLLSALLGNHPEVYAPPEPWILLRLAGVYGEAADSSRLYDDYIASSAVRTLFSEEDFLISARTFALTMYNRLLEPAKGRVLVDKTPRYYHIIDWIETLFPAARMIWLKRNPLDVAASYKTTWQRDISFLTGDSFDSTSFDFLLGLPNLVAFFNKPGNNRLEIRYEDLVKQPSEEMKRVAEFCGLDFTQNMAELNSAGKGLSVLSSSPFGDKKIHQCNSIHTSALDSWQQNLEPDEALKLTSYVGHKTFERMGYAEFVSHNPDLFKTEQDEETLSKLRECIIAKAKTFTVSTYQRLYSLENSVRESGKKIKELKYLNDQAAGASRNIEAQNQQLKNIHNQLQSEQQRQGKEYCAQQELSTQKTKLLLQRISDLELQLHQSNQKKNDIQ